MNMKPSIFTPKKESLKAKLNWHDYDLIFSIWDLNKVKIEKTMSKDKTKVIERIQARIKPENRQFVQKALEISYQIQYILEKKGWSQKDLAEKLEMSESEISKILSGLQDITLKTLSKIEVVLGEEIIDTPIKASQ